MLKPVKIKSQSQRNTSKLYRQGKRVLSKQS